jgi:hypothetical protein
MSKQYFNFAIITRDNDAVTVNVTKVYEDGGQIINGLHLSDAALTARAVADGRTTWDNSDLYALTPCEPWPTVAPEAPV